MWSGRVVFDGFKEIDIPIRDVKSKKVLQILHVTIRKIGFTTYGVVEQVMIEDNPQLYATRNGLMIQNDLDVDLIVYQSCFENDKLHFEIKSGESCSFGWDRPDLIKKSIYIKSKQPGCKFYNDIEFSFEKKIASAYRTGNPVQNRALETDICYKDYKKILKFFSPSIKKLDKVVELSHTNNFSVLVEITRVTISFIIESNKIRDEFLMLSMDNLHVEYADNQNKNIFNVKIRSLDIDNNLVQSPFNPVKLTALYPKELDKEDLIQINFVKEKTLDSGKVNINHIFFYD